MNSSVAFNHRVVLRLPLVTACWMRASRLETKFHKGSAQRVQRMSRYGSHGGESAPAKPRLAGSEDRQFTGVERPHHSPSASPSITINAR
ncbi:MAG: hypothetical protein H7A20_04855 [Rhodanobacteraceae bacterium]|nr:hypothetical protein [Rhodanobacteraceae bacterium]